MLALASASTSYTLNSLSSRRATTTAQPQLTMAASNVNWAAAPLAAALAATTIASAASAAEPWAYSTLVNNIETDAVANVVFAPNGLQAVAIDPQGADHAVQLFPEAQLDLVHSLSAAKVPFAVQPTPTPGAVEIVAGGLGSLVASVAPPLLLFGGLSFLASRSGMGGMPGGPGGPGAMGKSKSTMVLDADTGVTFADVAGCEGSKQELTEIVEFLKNPTKYSKLGAKIPRGAVMEGPPGTGKTLLARAVAGEAGVPFISASGSEFVEMFVGVGASRVRLSLPKPNPSPDPNPEPIPISTLTLTLTLTLTPTLPEP